MKTSLITLTQVREVRLMTSASSNSRHAGSTLILSAGFNLIVLYRMSETQLIGIIMRLFEIDL
jgi:hypothetical protein